MTPEEIRDMLVRMADSLERMETDNAALKAVLGNARHRPGEPPLQTQVDDIIRDAANNPIHQRYEEFRAEIQRAYENRRLQELLVRFPPVGIPN